MDTYASMSNEQLKDMYASLKEEYNKYDALQNNCKLRGNSLNLLGL